MTTQVMYVTPVIGPNVDGILVTSAEELDEMQFHLAITAVETGLSPVQERLRA